MANPSRHSGACKRIPILMLHSAGEPFDRSTRSWIMRPRRIDRLARYLKERGWRSLSLQSWHTPGAQDREFVITIDDGYADFYTEIFPHLHDWGWAPTVFVVTSRVGQTNTWDDPRYAKPLLTREQIIELARHGVRFGAHSCTHPWLPSLEADQIRREVAESKRSLEDLLGSRVDHFAYPYGGFDQRVRDIVEECGFTLALTTEEGRSCRCDDPLLLRRVNLSDTDNVAEFALKLATGRDWWRAFVDRVPQSARRAAKRLLRDGAR